MTRRDARVGILFALPWIFGFLIFLAYPLIASLISSFTNFSILRPPKFIGLQNYNEMVHDEVFYKSLGNTLLYVLGAVPLTAVVAIGLSLASSSSSRCFSWRVVRHTSSAR